MANKEQQVRSDWQRMTNPKTAADYAIGVKLSDLELYAPDILVNEVAPVLASQFGEEYGA